MDSSVEKRTRTPFRELIRIHYSSTPWHLPVFQAMCLGLPLWIGIATGRFHDGLIAAMTALMVLYYPEETTTAKRMLVMLLCGFGVICSYTVGLLFNFHWLIACSAFGIFSFAIHWVVNYYKLHNPRSLVFILAASIAFCAPTTPNQIPHEVGIIAMGTMTTCILSFIYSLISTPPGINATEIDVAVDKTFNLYESIIVGIAMFICLWIGLWFKLENPYWIPISCMTIMQGVSFSHVMERTAHRIIGTLVGLVVAWGLALWVRTPVSITLTLMILQFGMGTLLSRNYGLAVIFITPLTILLNEFSPSEVDLSMSTLIARGLDIAIGCLVGVVGGWLLYRFAPPIAAPSRKRHGL
ncbi:FUSC family protein [Pontibacter sp. G13]|uniref:FUSC family protein n=1 Tax=Pontibacter sp. G13 TaxID=3074898 RepID=UPI00288C0817|nr:FUSC family protein [Pontibacter sp. G13]WNJ18371.1 FUSC family protein [Pontibacter sp. G13]